MSDPRIDPRAEALGVYITDHPEVPFRILSVQYQDPQEAQGQHNIFYHVLDENGRPMPNQRCYMDWVGRPPKEDPPSEATSDGNGSANLAMYSNLDIHNKNGPYFAYLNATVVKNVPSNIQSDEVHGMGLPEHQHVNFVLTYQKNGTPIPPPPTGQWTIQTQSENSIVLVKK